jgi:hypothetical protein
MDVRQVIEGCRRVLGWFDARRDSEGLYLSNWEPPKNRGYWECCYSPSEPDFHHDDALNLFIDHPGMGWHNAGEAGIDRRGINAAINALLVMGRHALADLEQALGNVAQAADLRASAEDLASKVGRLFCDPDTRVFRDGRLNGELLPQVSEQTNTWAIAAGCCDDQAAHHILQSLLTGPDPKVARNGPYFWTYLFPLLAAHNLPQVALDKIRDAWGAMVDAGASTLWETFKGDNLDTWCHPWSAAPVEFLLTGVLGLPPACLPGQAVTLRPRFDVLPEATGNIVTAAGPFSITWTKDGAGTVHVRGTSPTGVSVALVTPDGERFDLHGPDWSITKPTSPARVQIPAEP